MISGDVKVDWQKFKESLKISKGYLEVENQRTDNIIVKIKRTNNDPQNTS